MRTNRTKAKLKAGEAVFGAFMRFTEPTLIDFLGYQPWDFMVFDGEHGTLEPRDCENLVRAAELHDITPLVRVTTNLPPIILRFMDTGAQGLQIPWVNTATEADLAVRAVKYHPRGVRGLAGVRAADFLQRSSLGEYVEQANRETLVIIQVETAEAVENLHEIVAVDGVDVIFIGPSDLSHSLGLPGEMTHPRVQEAFQQIIDIVNASDVALGTLVRDVESAREWLAKGAQYLAISPEPLLVRATRDFLEAVRE